MNKTDIRRFGYILLALMAWSIVSCDSQSNRANILPADVQYMADTMFAHRRGHIIELVDSLCLINQEELIKSMKDSLVQMEIGRIDKILGRD